MNKADRTELNRELLKHTSKCELNRVLDLIGCVGLKGDIAYKIIIEKKSPVQICMELNISESTYHRYFNNILIKVHMLLRGL